MSTETLLLELGTEELPPKALKTLGLSFKDGICEGLERRELGVAALGSTERCRAVSSSR